MGKDAMNSLKTICAVVASVCGALFAAVPELERTGSIYHSYEAPTEAEAFDTPPPEGYSPFYISHYGRHGSRRLMDSKAADIVSNLEKAKSEGMLTGAGLELAEAMRPLAAAHAGMKGILTKRGAEEHKGIARRMAARFPEVFAGGGLVRARSSDVHRCILSMANFTLALKDAAESLDFDLDAGKKYYRLFTYGADVPPVPTREVAPLKQAFAQKTVAADALMERLFGGCPKCVKDPVRFALDLFECASVCQCLRDELDGGDIYRFFTQDELEALSRVLLVEHYAFMGCAREFSKRRIASVRSLGADIASRADEAIAHADGSDRRERPVADFRFGHDGGLWPLTGLLGVEGAGDIVAAADAWQGCPAWRWMQMGSNLQLVFYRKDAGEVLVKALYNEREVKLRGLSPVQGAYYRWQDVRTRLLGQNEDRNQQ